MALYLYFLYRQKGWMTLFFGKKKKTDEMLLA
jgi:hypothetical protein